MLYHDQQGHDAILDGIEVDAVGRTISVHLQAYPESDAPERVRVDIVFKDVVSFVSTAELGALADHRAAGNVNHWHIADGEGTSHIYLIEGHIAIASPSAPVLVRR